MSIENMNCCITVNIADALQRYDEFHVIANVPKYHSTWCIMVLSRLCQYESMCSAELLFQN